MSYTSLVHKLIVNGKFESVTFGHTYVKGMWITECKLHPKGVSTYFSGIGIHSDITESINSASRCVYAQTTNTTIEEVIKPKSNSHQHRRTIKNKDRSCNGVCRCISFYGLHPDTHIDEITRQCKRFGKVSCAFYNRWNTQERFISVWMTDSRDADDVVTHLNGEYFRECKMTVMKGHHIQARYDNLDVVDDLDKFTLPPRPAVKPVITKEQLDKELDEYMRNASEDEGILDKEIDEYMRNSKGI